MGLWNRGLIVESTRDKLRHGPYSVILPSKRIIYSTMIWSLFANRLVYIIKKKFTYPNVRASTISGRTQVKHSCSGSCSDAMRVETLYRAATRFESDCMSRLMMLLGLRRTWCESYCELEMPTCSAASTNACMSLVTIMHLRHHSHHWSSACVGGLWDLLAQLPSGTVLETASTSVL
jgi:hypothetical protein